MATRARRFHNRKGKGKAPLLPPRQKKRHNSFCNVPRRIAQQTQKLSDESEAQAGTPVFHREEKSADSAKDEGSHDFIEDFIQLEYHQLHVDGVSPSFENDPRGLDMSKPWRVR
jgi:hypothetical protein